MVPSDGDGGHRFQRIPWHGGIEFGGPYRHPGNNLPASWYDTSGDGYNGDLIYNAGATTLTTTQLNNLQVVSTNTQIEITGQYISLLGINVEYSSYGTHICGDHFAVEDDTFSGTGQGILGGGLDPLIQNNYVQKTGYPGTNQDHDMYLSGDNLTVTNNFCTSPGEKGCNSLSRAG